MISLARQFCQAERSTVVTTVSRRPMVLAAFVAGIFSSLLVVWFFFDHRLPGIDQSGHILNSLHCRDLLSHPKFWKPGWWHELLTVNSFYPPFLYIFNGFLKLIFSSAYWVDLASLVIFDFVLGLSVFATTWLLSRNVVAAALATVCINFYPQITWLSHTPMIDFPLVAMVSLGLLALVWFSGHVSWRRALVAGIVLSAACMSKQIAAGFLAGPGIACLAMAAVSDAKAKQLKALPKVFVIPLVVVLLCAPWVVLNHASIGEFARYNEASMGSNQSFLGNLWFYLAGLPHAMSPLLFWVFLASFLVLLQCRLLKDPGSAGFQPASVPARCRRSQEESEWHGRKARTNALPMEISRFHEGQLLAVGVSAIGGILLISTIGWTFPLDRYAMPALIAPAIYTGVGLATMLQRWKALGKIAVAGVTGLAALQFVSFNFAPYPITRPVSLVALSSWLNVWLREFRGTVIARANPRAPEDWQQDFVLNFIAKVDGRTTPVWLNIVPCCGNLNVHTFEWIASQNGIAVKPTSSRVWTVMGDRIEFSEKSALYFHWYLLKTGDQGNITKDPDSQANYTKLMDFVKSSGKFRLMASRPLPDGSTMLLYRQR